MPETALNRNELEQKYQELSPLYEKLGKTLLVILGQTLTQIGVELLGLSYRVKDFDSFRDKAEREGYEKPFEECQDLCGLRIIHFYKSDAVKILHLIKELAQVVEISEEELSPAPERFGFHAVHIIAKLKEEALKHPALEDLAGLKAEIQIMTTVMNTYNQIEQHLAYLQKEQIPQNLQRKFFQLAATFNIADDMLEDLRGEKDRHFSQIAQKAKNQGGLEVSLPMNLDNLQAFLDFYFPKRKKNLKVVSWLLANIILPNQITMRDLILSFEKAKAHLPQIESGLSELLKETYFFKEKEFEQTQGIMLMTILSLTNDSYWNIIVNLFDERYWEKLLQFFNTWRGKLGKFSDR